MKQSRPGAFRGNLESLFEQELRAIEEEKLLARLWHQDVSLWPAGGAGPQHLQANLEFLGIPERLPQMVSRALDADAESRLRGLTQRLVIFFGTIHYFSNALLNLLPDEARRECVVLESCHPADIRDGESRVNLRKTLVVLANKSGYQVEDHSVFLYFREKMQKETGQEEAGQFVAASGANTFLASIASEYRFRFLLDLPAEILAPFCSVISWGVLLSALAKLEPEVLRVACRDMKKQYSDDAANTGNPASELAAFLSATSRAGRSFIHFLAPAKLAPFAAGLCPLIATSLGKEEGGLFPVLHTMPCETEPFDAASSFVVLRSSAESDRSLEERIGELRARGIPFLELWVATPLDLLRETFRWQLALVLAAARMRVNPFEPCDTRLPRTIAAGLLNELSTRRDALQRRPRIREGKLEVFAEGRTRLEISQLNLTECLATFFAHRNAARYAALLIYIERTKEAEAVFVALKDQLTRALRIPVFLAWGPRTYDMYGCLLHGSSVPGLRMMVTASSSSDLKIPGANYSFDELYRALALGQFEGLPERNGLALRIHLEAQTEEALRQLQNVITNALKRIPNVF
ncbi:MAG TPA: hypothetical protein VL128_04320 [Candidatus Eisenbacteria bacterium]|nr:hypothetical protein [Candidatus Eisenbacteria bacterium]